MPSGAKKSLFSVVSVVLFYGLIELVFILAGFTFQPMTHCGSFGDHFEAGDSHYLRDARRFWIPKPDTVIHADWVGSGGAHISSLSTRGAEPTVPKPEDVFRILCLGDSGTFGFGVNDDETWPAHLERQLNTGKLQPDIELQFEVVNAGVNGFTTFQAVEHYKVLESILEPDMVILSTGRNDLVALQMADQDRPIISSTMLTIAEWVQYSRLGQWMLYFNQKEMKLGLNTVPLRNEDRILRVNVTQFVELVEFMITDNTEKDRPFVFLARGGHWRHLRELKQRDNFTLIDLYPLDQLGQIMMFLEGGHPDSNALNLVAEYCYETLIHKELFR